MPDASVIEQVPTRLMEAMEENLLGHVSFLQERVAGMSVVRHDGVTLVDSGLESDTFNKILGARLEGTEIDDRIERALAYFHARERPYTWWVGPTSRPLDLESRLKRHGLHPEEYELGMTIELADLPESWEPSAGTRVLRVRTREALSGAAGVLAALHEPPDDSVIEFFDRSADVLLEESVPMRLFLASVNGEPAAVSELFLEGDVAGVHMVATSERYRRRGLGMTMTWTALDEGRRAGAAVGALQAAPEGESVYRKLGFRPCGRFVEYAPASGSRATA